MTSDKSLFNMPFTPDGSLKPKPDQLHAFLESIGGNGGNGGNGQRGNDLVSYRRQIENAFAFGQTQLQDARKEDLHKQMVSAVLRYSRFADHNLLSALELYKYHLHTLKLKSIDNNTLVSFIRSAEKTVSRLSKDKLDDVLRIVRLQEMIGERKKMIETLKPPALAVSAELCRTAQYIQNTLARIAQRCEASIAVLSDPNVMGEKLNQIIDDIKGRPQKALLAGKFAAENLERAQQEVNLIAETLSSVVREDINTLTSVYAALQEQLRKMMPVLEVRLAEFASKKKGSIEEHHRLFSAIEHAFISLSTRTFDRPAQSVPVDRAFEKFITKKRKEMLAYLFDVLKKDRRSAIDRRSSRARRKFSEPNYQESQRRSGKDRRTGNNRRKR